MVMTKGERDSTLCATAKLVCGSMKNVIQSLKNQIKAYGRESFENLNICMAIE